VSSHNALAELDTHVLDITRIFDAPRALVFGAFVDAKQVRQWLGPRGYTMTYLDWDMRPGGVWRGWMRANDGRELWHGGVHREVTPERRLVFTFAFDLADGRRGPETLVTITFEDRGGKTLMRFHQSGFVTPSDAENYRAGWDSEFDQLTRLLDRN
jgi:uncharacterized protein YndB with AHSA1/START domain